MIRCVVLAALLLLGACRFGEPRVPADTLRTVPDVTDETVAEATSDLEDEGFLVQLVQRDGEQIDATRCSSAKVTEQDPGAGQEVLRATTVTITVDRCPA